jgi:phenylacetate-CoA ligase
MTTETTMITYPTSHLETASPHERADYQLDRLRRQVARVRDTSPFYEDRLAEIRADGPASFEEFYAGVAPVTKAELISDVAEHPPFGRLLSVSTAELCRLYVHPGPQAFAWTANDQQHLVEMYAQGMTTAGFGPGDLVDITVQYAWVMAGTIWDAAFQRAGALVLPGGAGGTGAHIERLSSLPVTTLMGFPTYLEEIAVQAQERGLDPRVDFSVSKLLVIGELRGRDAKERLRAMYDAEFVREAYGAAEIGLVSAECSHAGGGMHLHPDVLVEVRDPETGELVGDGEPGELYLTPLSREAMPVLRYRTGDITEYLRAGRCDCGRTTPRMGRILGRISDLFRVKGVFLVPRIVESLVHGCAGAEVPYQLVISRPTVRDEVLLRVEHPDSEASGLTGALVSQFKERCNVAISVEVSAPGTLVGIESRIVDQR